MPTLRQRPDGRFFIDYREISGARVRRIIEHAGAPVRDAALAERLFDQFCANIAQADTQPVTTGPDPRVRDVTDYYQHTYLPARNAAKKTYTSAARHLEMFLDYCATRRVGRVSQLSGQIVEGFAAWLSGRNVAPATVKNHIGTVRAAISMAIDAGLLENSPVRRWVLPRVPEPEIWPLTPEQVTALVAMMREHAPAYAAVTEWIALTGNRPSDAVSLLWRHVDLDAGHVERVSVKSKAIRQYSICAAAVALLRGLSQDGPMSPVFTAPEGGKMTVNKVYHAVTRTAAAHAFGRKVCPKDLRHTFGSLMANPPISCPLPTLRILMGHARIETTLRYVHSEDGRGALDAFQKLLNKP